MWLFRTCMADVPTIYAHGWEMWNEKGVQKSIYSTYSSELGFDNWNLQIYYKRTKEVAVYSSGMNAK